MRETKDVRLQLRVTADLVKRIDEAAALRGLSRSAYIRMAVLELLRADEAKRE